MRQWQCWAHQSLFSGCLRLLRCQPPRPNPIRRANRLRIAQHAVAKPNQRGRVVIVVPLADALLRAVFQPLRAPMRAARNGGVAVLPLVAMACQPVAPSRLAFFACAAGNRQRAVAEAVVVDDELQVLRGEGFGQGGLASGEQQ